MADREFLVLVRFDVESFRWSPESGRAELYPDDREVWDQTRLLERLVNLLDSHGARGSFAVAYDILKRHPQMLKPILDSSGNHEITWHLHMRWDQSFTEDWGEEPGSCYVAGYSEAELNRILDIVHGTCERALGFVPKINLSGCLSVNARVLKVLEERGYLVQGDYSPNTDYRITERFCQYCFEGREPIPGGPGSPCYPYAPNNIYTPNRWEGMLLGDMKIIEVPLTQFQPGRGDGRQDTYRDPDADIASMLRLYDREADLTTCSMLVHTHKMAMGPNPYDVSEQALSDLNRVLGFARALPHQRFANYMEAREAYLASVPDYQPGQLVARDAANGVLAYDGSSSLKIHALGSVASAEAGSVSLTIGQENGIAQWYFEGVALGPETEPKLSDQIESRPAMLTVDLISHDGELGMPHKDLRYVWQKQQDMLGVNLVDADTECQFLYVLHENDALSITTFPKSNGHTPSPVYTANLCPKLRPFQIQSGRILMKHQDADLMLEIRVLQPGTQSDEPWVPAPCEPEISFTAQATQIRLAASTSSGGAIMLVVLPFILVPERKEPEAG